jgi:glycosyltransferase involved in cell wall biosynthesis
MNELRIWIDVEDLFEYAGGNSRPTGIQRVVTEICQALHALFGDRGQVNFVRHDATEGLFRVVPWSAIATLFEVIAKAPPEPPPPQPEVLTTASYVTPGSSVYLTLRRLVYRLPPEVRTALVRFGLAELGALSAMVNMFRPRPRAPEPPPSPPPPEPVEPAEPAEPSIAPIQASPDPAFVSRVAAGDVLLVPGAPWSVADHSGRVARARERFGLRFAMIFYDIIPIRHPEWCVPALVTGFATWLERSLPLCDTVFTISRAGADELRRYADGAGMKLVAPIIPLTMGSGFSARAGGAPRRFASDLGSYALVVSTIEPRKNHALLFQVWRRLLEDLPRDRVPTLVFAGRIGWMVNDLMQQLRNAAFLDGKIVLINHPSDLELEALYRGCLFTLLPSFAEGWGLPVIESLAAGKPCLVADIPALREAGGALVRSFDPENGTEAYRVIRGVIEDPIALEQWQQRIRQEFRPVSWRQTAEALVGALQIVPTA